jgi:asparagine N-glycosylation enzyme membrane subunit Stt3
MKSSSKVWVIIGDILMLGLVTLFGFASHDELGTAGTRMMTTFVPLVFAWVLISPWLGVFRDEIMDNPRQLWRPFWAMVLAGPMAAWIRGAWLQRPIVPLFVVILGGVSALALLAWRTIFWLITSRRN